MNVTDVPEPPVPQTELTSDKVNWAKWVRLMIWLLVLAGLAYALWRATLQLQEQPVEWSQVRWRRLLAAVVVYCGAQLTVGWFWHQVLRSWNFNLSLSSAWRAFCVSQLGKYLPGKAMVVVIRADLIRGSGVTLGPAITSVFIETLMWIFVGAQLSSWLLLFLPWDGPWLRLFAVGILLGSGAATLPPVFNRVLELVARLKRKTMAATSNVCQLNWRIYWTGWACLTGGWLLVGASAALVLSAFPGVVVEVKDWGLILAAVALATVGGFVSLIPGGLGVKELVLIPLLASRFGMVMAVVGALSIRLTSIVAEGLLSATMETVHRQRSSSTGE